MSTNKQFGISDCKGFTLVEVMVASAISTMVLLSLVTFFISTYSYWNGVNLRMEADSDANIAMSRMVYGMGDRLGLRTAKEVNKTNDGNGGWTVTYTTGGDTPQANSFVYSSAEQSIIFNPGDDEQIAGRDIVSADFTVDNKLLTLTLCVEKEQGKLKASREINTKVHFRNTKD